MNTDDVAEPIPPTHPTTAAHTDPHGALDRARARAPFLLKQGQQDRLIRSIKTDIFSLTGGEEIRVTWPAAIDPADWLDMEVYLQLLRRKLARAAGQGRTTDAR